MTKKAVRGMAVGLLLVVLLMQSLGLAALAEGAEAITLANNVAVGGVLAGSAAGGFAYYQMEYPGDSADARIQVTFGPHDPTLNQQLGVNVYGPNGYQGKGEMQEEGYLEVSYGAEDAVTLLVQVYNYSDQAMPFSVVATGLPEAAAETVAEGAVTEAAAPEASATAQETTSATPVTNTLVGSLAGAFGQHALPYAGDETDVTVTVDFAPEEPSFKGAFGFTVYDPNGTVVASGVSNDVLGQRTATFASDVAGSYLILVYNYTDGLPFTYTLTTSS